MTRSRGSEGSHPLRWLAPAAVLLVAAALRLWNLHGLPEGLHGDEAWTGLDARRVLAEGWIGPYVPSALGQPTGPVYLVAALMHWLPDDIGTVRLAMALFGVLGVFFTFLLAREYEGPVVGTFAAALLAGSLWHLHASRVGMMFVSCPVPLLAGLWLEAVARRRRSVALLALAGFVAGLGVYTYNAYPVAVPLFALPFAYAFAAAPAGTRRFRVAEAGVFSAAALIAAAPMLDYVYGHWTDYVRHHQLVSLFPTPEWAAATGTERAHLLFERARSLGRGLVWEGQFDGGDGFGVGAIPVLGLWPAALAGAGALLALLRWRRVLCAVALIAVPLISAGALVTVGAGMYRRTIALAPFVAILGALPLAALWGRGMTSRRDWSGALRAVAASAVAATVAYGGVATYFGPFVHDAKLRWVFARDLRAIGELAATMPRDTRIYLFAERWGCGYETMRYLAPGMPCTDRSRRFGKTSRHSRMLDFAVGVGQPALFVLSGEHMQRRQYLRMLAEQDPQAEEIVGEIDGQPAFLAIHLPHGAVGKMAAAGADVPDQGDGPLAVADLSPLDVVYDFQPPRADLTWDGQPVVLGGRKFEHALGMHAPTEMTFATPPRALALRAVVGLSDAVKGCARASVVFEVRDQAGRVLAASGVVRGGDAPRPLTADLRGVAEFALVASDAGDGRDCDHANWGDPLIDRSPAASVQPKAAAAPQR